MTTEKKQYYGLREQMAHASSEKALAELESKANSFDYASDKTRRAWARTADRRRKFLKKTEAA